eukprot:scaffold105954_cov75-Phaeocystis_antarctica.AAC.1
MSNRPGGPFGKGPGDPFGKGPGDPFGKGPGDPFLSRGHRWPPHAQGLGVCYRVAAGLPGPGLKLLKLRTHVTTIFSPPPTTNSAPADDAYDDAYMLACAVRACNGQQKCDVYPSSVCSVLKVQQQADKNTAEA